MDSLRSSVGLLLFVCVGALAGAASVARAQDENEALQIAREVTPGVERAVGLRFKRTPAIEVRSREQVRGYLSREFAEQEPPAELAAVQRTYRAFALIPDTTDLRRLMLNLYSEQVAGFYDPDSSALFVVGGTDPAMVEAILAHELVHALQDQYMSLNAILKLKHQNDRQMAGQAVAEGQATLAGIEAMVPPGTDVAALLGTPEQLRQRIRAVQGAMPVYASAPLFVQEGLLFPYIEGAQFIRDFDERRTRPDQEPYGEALPISTAQVLHPDLYTRHLLPERVGFGPDPGDTLIYDDDFGEFETGVALRAWGVDDAVAEAAADGWDGDRFEVLGSASGTVVMWAAAWRTAQDADQFQRALTDGWGRSHRGATQRWRVDRLDIRGVPVVRLVSAPAAWKGWARLPAIVLATFSR
jgi:hypothetical protein